MKNIKLEKKNNFKNFKVKPAILAAILAGSITIGAGGFLIGSHSNSNQVSAPSKQNSAISTDVDFSDEKLNTDSPAKITSINTYKLQLSDFDEVITPAFDDNEEQGIFEIEDCQIKDNNYNIKVSDGNVIVSQMDNAMLVDNEFDARNEDTLVNDLSQFTNVIVNRYNELQDVTVDALSLEKLGSESLFLCDTSSQRTLKMINEVVVTFDHPSYEETSERILYTTDNIIPYRILDSSTATTQYSNLNNYYSVGDIEINGKIISTLDFLGYKDIQINGIDFRSVCAKCEDGLYREFLTTKEHCILLRRIQKSDPPVSGNSLNCDYETKAIGNFDMQYKRCSYFYENVKEAYVGEDNMYYINSYDDVTHAFPTRLYSFESIEPINSMPENSETLDVSEYYFQCYDKGSFKYPILSSKKTLVKVGDSYLYVLEKPILSNPEVHRYENTPVDRPATGIYSAQSMILARTISEEEFNSNYTATSAPMDFVFNLCGDTFGDGGVNDSGNSKYVAFKEKNLLGLEYYSIIRQYVDYNDKKTRYQEILVPKPYVAIKGNEQDVVKVLK